ncbi:hypothetical protein [Aminipila sp.]|uniref:hypothetical protein n=1 Tax=Aminipila sp. TaxID=2060095 RepID=UPI0028A00C97|nr:hypothetical protein [Aminipila sp.]
MLRKITAEEFRHIFEKKYTTEFLDISNSIKISKIKNNNICIKGFDIESFILTDIRVQEAMSFLYNVPSVEYYTVSHNIGFKKNKSFEKQVSELYQIFDNISVLETNSKIFAFQVSKVKKDAIEIYAELVNSKRVNAFINHFTSKELADDLSEESIYIYFPENMKQSDLKLKERLASDEYIQYLLKDDKQFVSGNCISVSHLTLNEINDDPYIKAFSNLISDPLFLDVSMEYEFNQYTKFLRW